MSDTVITVIDPNTGNYIAEKEYDNGDGTFSRGVAPITVSGVIVTTPSASELHIGQVGGTTLWAEATFQRPANVSGYVIGDMVSNSVTSTTLMTLSGVARTNSGTGYITKLRFGTNQVTNVAQYRLWFYTVSNPTVVADNVPFTMLWANKSSRLGYIDMPVVATEKSGSDSAFAMWINNGVFAFTTASQDKNLYVAVETETAFTPDSGQSFYLEVFTDVN